MKFLVAMLLDRRTTRTDIWREHSRFLAQSLTSMIALLLFIPKLQADDGLKKTLSTIAQESAIRLLKEKRFDFENADFAGTFEAIDPEHNVKVEVRDFSLANDTVKVQVQINGLFRLKGKFTKGGSATQLDADLSLEIIPTAEAKIVKRDQDFFVQPSIKALAFKVGIRELKPESLAGGKSLVTDILNTTFVKRKEEILKAVNAALAEKKLDL